MREALDLFAGQLSHCIRTGEPCLFVIDFEMKKPFICALSEAASHGIWYQVKGQQNFQTLKDLPSVQLSADLLDKELFTERLEEVVRQINAGNSYLLNLTFPTRIGSNLSLKELFHVARAPYKLYFKDQFIVFSPECFVKIIGDEIFTYPMKGTIDARRTDAEKQLLGNQKEEWEHNTIVDLMRNDLAMISQNIEITKYRYVERIKNAYGDILQTSSEITGQLSSNWRETFGQDLLKLLPAGSISGAPKEKTVEIIQANEIDDRGYYTGVFGVFDGVNLDSAVMIRYIEQRENQLYFRSGGGITSQSNAIDEYQELLAKIYVGEG
ncbi:MAG: aminodeoxychorismate synthase component I [Bacteroidota bacterium]